LAKDISLHIQFALVLENLQIKAIDHLNYFDETANSSRALTRKGRLCSRLMQLVNILHLLIANKCRIFDMIGISIIKFKNFDLLKIIC
jgi:hypothetical protein